MRVGKNNGRREGAEDDITQLNAAWGDGVAKGEVIFTKEFGEIVEKYEKKPERPAIKVSSCYLEIRVVQKWIEKFEQGQQQLVERGPSLKSY
jgi:hypothetical protein